MKDLLENARVRLRDATNGSTVALQMLATTGAAVVAVAIALLLPSTAAAVPGSGEFVALDSGSGREITELYNMIARICLGILIIVEGALLFAIIKFRRRDPDENPVQNHGDLRLEFGWTMAALAIQVWIGVATIDVMFSTETEPEAGMDMTVTAYAEMWDWNFEYDLEDRERLVHEDLVIPAHHNVKIEVTSEDVIHAIFIPALGVKMDAVPGRFNHWWVRADGPLAQVRTRGDHATIERPEYEYPQTRNGTIRGSDRDATARRTSGLEQHVTYMAGREDYELIEDPQESPYYGYNAIEYQGVCAELCGTGHWDMYFRTVVMTPSSFDRWYQDELQDVDEPDGESVFAEECSQAGCHGTDGSPDADDVPSLVGSDMTTDPERTDDHIENVLTGPGRMPPFRGSLNDAEIAAVVNHERSAWDNDAEIGEEQLDDHLVDPEDVAEMRDQLGFDPFPAAAVDPIDTEDLMREGRQLYSSCASCHGDDGQSPHPDLVPNIAGSDVVLDEDPEPLARLLIEGRDTDEYPGRKRRVARTMTDRQLAALMTYLRQSFDNDAEPVQPFDIMDVR